jgi:hypothetical protein
VVVVVGIKLVNSWSWWFRRWWNWITISTNYWRKWNCKYLEEVEEEVEMQMVVGSGGKGVVILSMPTANFSNTTTGSPTESYGGNKILVFNGSGSYTT